MATAVAVQVGGAQWTPLFIARRRRGVAPSHYSGVAAVHLARDADNASRTGASDPVRRAEVRAH